jgi:hypothetical protein
LTLIKSNIFSFSYFLKIKWKWYFVQPNLGDLGALPKGSDAEAYLEEFVKMLKSNELPEFNFLYHIHNTSEYR